jgi:hypothetical protein
MAAKSASSRRPHESASLFGLHWVEEHVAREVIDAEEEVGEAADGWLEWSGDVAEDALAGAFGGGDALRRVG